MIYITAKIIIIKINLLGVDCFLWYCRMVSVILYEIMHSTGYLYKKGEIKNVNGKAQMVEGSIGD